VEEVNATGLIYIKDKSLAVPPKKKKSFPKLSAEALKASVMRSIVSGVKTIGVSVLGAMLGRKKVEGPSSAPPNAENSFYYDGMHKRWRQHGVEDPDVSQIDPNTGRQKADPSVALPPPPMTPTSGSFRGSHAVGSLYVDPTKPPPRPSVPVPSMPGIAGMQGLLDEPYTPNRLPPDAAGWSGEAAGSVPATSFTGPFDAQESEVPACPPHESGDESVLDKLPGLRDMGVGPGNGSLLPGGR